MNKHLMMLSCLIAAVVISCNNKRQQGNNDNNLSNVSLKIEPKDSIRRINDSISILTKSKKGKKIFSSYIQNNHLNGPAELYDSDGNVVSFGTMKSDKLIGLWRFGKKNAFDSVVIYLTNGQIKHAPVSTFSFKEEKIWTPTASFIIQRPYKWRLITMQKDIAVGITENENEHATFKVEGAYKRAKPYNLKEAVWTVLDNVEKEYGQYQIIKEGYLRGKIGDLYQLELEILKNGTEYLYFTTIFMDGPVFYEILGVAQIASEYDFFLYKYLFMELTFNVQRAENAIQNH